MPNQTAPTTNQEICPFSGEVVGSIGYFEYALLAICRGIDPDAQPDVFRTLALEYTTKIARMHHLRREH